MGECAHFSFNKCPIYTLDGASAKFSTKSHEMENSVTLVTETPEYLLADRRPGWKVKLVQVLDPVHKLLHFTDFGDRYT